MLTVKDIYGFIDDFAPFSTQCGFDNAGLLVGNMDASVTKVTVCLDITRNAVGFAAENGCELIVSHHPVIFDPLRSVGTDNPVYGLCCNLISAVCAHTNVDAAPGGVNDTLAQILELTEVVPLGDEEVPLARIGLLDEELSSGEFAEYVRQRLGAGCVRYTETKRPVRKVAVCGGAGADYMDAAIKAGADALVTSEVKHHQLLSARQHGFCIMDAGHFATERPIVSKLAEMLAARFKELEIFTYKTQDPAAYVCGEPSEPIA